MSPLQALLLGVVQGLTEFLPVSSSGHLVLGKEILGVTDKMRVTFEVVVHLGTLVATLLVFRQPIWEILVFLGRAVRPAKYSCGANPGEAARGGLWRRWWDDPAGRLLGLIVLATIPAGVVGVLFEDQIEDMFGSALLVGMALCVTGTWLFVTRWVGPRDDAITGVSAGKGLLVGIAQAIAITPGISRSGATIATGLLCGMGRETAARFSFLLSVPAVAGAVVLKARDIAEAGEQVGWSPLIVGFLASLAVGYAALRLLLAFVRHGRLHWFAYYCWLIGAMAIAAETLGWLHE